MLQESGAMQLSCVAGEPLRRCQEDIIIRQHRLVRTLLRPVAMPNVPTPG
jgi:hypothetical protein